MVCISEYGLLHHRIACNTRALICPIMTAIAKLSSFNSLVVSRQHEGRDEIADWTENATKQLMRHILGQTAGAATISWEFINTHIKRGSALPCGWQTPIAAEQITITSIGAHPCRAVQAPTYIKLPRWWCSAATWDDWSLPPLFLLPLLRASFLTWCGLFFPYHFYGEALCSFFFKFSFPRESHDAAATQPRTFSAK